MKPGELADEIEKLIVSANEKLLATIGKLQNLLFNRLNIVIKDLELDSEGYIKQSSSNRKVLRDAQSEFDNTVKASGFAKAVETHLKTIPKLDTLNTDYFKSISESFSTNRNFIRDLQKQIIQEVNQFILQDGLQANVKIPLNQILNTNVNSGGSFSGFQDQLRDFIKGNDQAEGRLLRYVRTYISDVLFNYSRAWQQAVTADLKLEYYLYSGGLMDTSRPFCTERAGQYFHQKEIEAWAELEWKGKNPLTTKSSIFILAGGYSCRHQIIPVHEIIVPKDVIERNQK
jgi:hypothetical protein